MSARVDGLRIGHWTDPIALTGCTVIIPPSGTRGSVFIPGNAPATRETDAIQPGRRVEFVNAVMLTGGSAFGLAAADGVMRWLEERSIGHPAPMGPVPIVPAAAIYDLLVGDPSRRPGAPEGYVACEEAIEGDEREGNIGAGTGATCGKTAGFENMSKAGLGHSVITAGHVVVEAIAIVNAVGDVVEEDGTVIAGARAAPMTEPPTDARSSTTIACVITNARLTNQQVHSLARTASAGLARAIRPVHTMWDGDTVFALATGIVDADEILIGESGADALADACRRAARAATDAGGVPARGRRADLPQGDAR